MASNKPESTLTWQDKLNKGLPLNPLDEVKADADFNYKQRLREEEEKKAFEERKTRGARAKAASDNTAADDESGQEGDK